MRRSLTLILAAGLATSGGPAAAQNKALELGRDKNAELHPGLREGLETLGRYADAISRQTGGQGSAPPAPKPRRLDTLADPFEVSPQLREHRRPAGSFGGLPSAGKLDLQRQIQVRARLISPKWRGAQLVVRGQEPITVMDKELLDLGDLGTYLVHVERDGVSLSIAGQPQTHRIVLR